MILGDTRRVKGMRWLLFLCATWGLCSAEAETPQSGQQSDQGDCENGTARVRVPRTDNHSGSKVCVPKPGQGCDPGFYRVRRGPYHRDCMPCDCNGLSECEDVTGRCLNCQYNTVGDHCEYCKAGYYGSAIQRTCCICPCPFALLSNSFATGCMELDEGFKCMCKPGYTGPRCERCAPGYYGNPLAFHGTCEPCNCNNGNPNVCDSRTGACINSLEPNVPDSGAQCLECDSCTQVLLEHLEMMDEELEWLKMQLKNPNVGPIAQRRLEKLEEAIAATQNLVRKYKNFVKSQGSRVDELRTDVNTLDADISQLREKANRILLHAQSEREKARKTYRRAEHLVSEARLLFLSIQDLLEQVKRVNASSKLDTEELSRMVREAKKMVQEMEQRDCSTQRKAADKEWEESNKLLRYIKNNISEPQISNHGEADRIAASLNWSNSKLKDLEAALKEANDNVRKATLQNGLNAPKLEDIQHHSKELRVVHNLVAGQISMAMDQLKDAAGLLKMLRDLEMEYEGLIAQLDGARTELIKRVNTISQAASKEPIVVKAEEHAKELARLARELEELVKKATNNSDVQQAINAIGTYKNITDTVTAAEEAARQAKETAEKLLNDVKREDFAKKAKDLKAQAEGLLTKANDARNEHKKATDEQAAQRKQLAQAQRKMQTLKQGLLSAQNKLAKIGRDDMGAILDAAKANAASANNSANTATDRIDSIRAHLEKMNLIAPDVNSTNFEDLNETVSNLTATIPSLWGLLNRTEMDSHLLSSKNNVSESIRRIKELIQQARDAANRIPVPVDFSGDGYVELRPPSDLEDLKAYTNLAFSLQRPVTSTSGRTRRQKPTHSGNMFVLYLGNRNSSKDYIGMALRDNKLHCVYMLGGAEHQIQSYLVTESPSEQAFFDRVNFHRIYQDVEVNFTKSSTSSNPYPPQSSSAQGDSLGTLLDLDPGEVVFYVGGYPDKIFTPPAPLRDLKKYTGCIEFSTVNDRFISLYNFKNAGNINRKLPCGRYSQTPNNKFFEGTGYARGTIQKQQNIYVFYQFIHSHSENSMLFYIGNEESYYTVIVENGYIVLRWREGNNVLEQKSANKEFPLTQSKELQVVLLGQAKKILVRLTGQDVITAKYTPEEYKSYYLGGLASSLRERYNITAPPFKGCMSNIKLDSIAVTFEDEIGVGRGCSSEFLAIRESTFALGGSLSAPPRGFKLNADMTISLGFRTLQNGGVLLKNSQGDIGMELSLVDGFVVFNLDKRALKSNRMYKDGKWHYLTVKKRGSRLEMRVDEEDLGQVQPFSSLVTANGPDVLLGKGTFQGCLTNLYMRRPGALYKPEDLSAFSSSGDVSVGVCAAEHPPQLILASLYQDPGRSAWKTELWQGDSTSRCSLPPAVNRAYHLGGPTSHLRYNITPQVLNYRPHFSLVFRTRSAEGLLLFVGSKRGHWHMALYITKGRIKLSVGGNLPITHKEMCNDGKWHTVMFSLEMNTFHLVVDQHRAMDGVLTHSNGSSLELQPPVFLGSVPQYTYTESQRLLPRESVVGCIRNFKMNNQWIEEPSANYGAPPCFNGNTEKGAYFSGKGGYVALDCRNSNFMGVGFHLEFEVRPRNMTGILLHIRDQHHPHLVLFMKNGEVVLKARGTAGESSVSVTQQGLCDGLFHRVTVSRKNTVQLTVDEKSEHMRGSSFSGISSGCHLYAGGVPDTFLHHKPPVKASFVGCIRNLRINGKPISFGEAPQVFGPVNTQECPAS